MSDYFGAMGTAIYSKLAKGTALITALGGTAIYADQAPDGYPWPFVIFSHVAGGPMNITPRDMRENIWWIRAYAPTRAAAAAIDGEVEQLLHKGTITVNAWTVFWLAREQDIMRVENLPDGKKVHMAGGMYRVRISA